MSMHVIDGCVCNRRVDAIKGNAKVFPSAEMYLRTFWCCGEARRRATTDKA